MAVGLSRVSASPGRSVQRGRAGWLEDQRGQLRAITLRAEQSGGTGRADRSWSAARAFWCVRCAAGSAADATAQRVPAMQRCWRRCHLPLFICDRGLGTLKPIRRRSPTLNSSGPNGCRRSRHNTDKQLRVYLGRIVSTSMERRPPCGLALDRVRRPCVQTEYEYLWVIGAVCPKPATRRPALFFGCRSSTLNTAIINVFLKPVQRHFRLTNTLSWCGTGRLSPLGATGCSPDITLIQLPPYSPRS